MIIFPSAFSSAFTRDKIDAIYISQDKIAEPDQALANDKDLRKIRTEKLDPCTTLFPSDLERINKLLPDSIDNVRLIIDLDNIASNTIWLSKMRGSNPTVPVMESSVEIVTLWSCHAFFLRHWFLHRPAPFLRDLETSLRLVDVTGLSFTASDKDSNDYAIEVRTYWLK